MERFDRKAIIDILFNQLDTSKQLFYYLAEQDLENVKIYDNFSQILSDLDIDLGDFYVKMLQRED